jgi:outer membrane receptor protein involved in Fe transport
MRASRLLLAVVVCCLAATAFAQVDRATLSGTVRDAQGGVVAKASVVVTNVATNVATRMSTNEEGAYLAVSLSPGHYLVEVEASGLAKSTQSVILEVGQRARLDFALGVGGVAESVTVEAATRLLSDNAALGTTVEEVAISKLPLAIRNWDDLLALVPGVQGDRYTEESGGTSTGRTGGVWAHGNRQLQNNFLLDGVDNNTISENVQELSTQVNRPSVDSIQEFKVVTSPYSAEYGRAPGAAISVTTKSGTNKFHGTAYDFYRNDQFDSNTFFAKRAGLEKAANNQNQFGGNLGGPILKDKAFFFVDYEGTRITKGVLRITRVPTADERAGRFGGAITDPLTGQPFPGNVIPSDRFDRVAATIVPLIPLPNQGGANNFIRQPNVTDESDRVMGRLDYRPSNADSIFGRYFWSQRDRFIPGAFGGIVDGTGTSAFGRQTIDSQGVVAGWTRIFGPTLVNEFRFSWSHAVSDAVQDPFGQAPPQGARVPGVPINSVIDGGLTGISVDQFFQGGGLGRIGSPDFLPKFQHTNQFEYLDTLSWLKGDHQIKVGFDVIAPMKNGYLDIPATRGSVRFRGRFTGNPWADFLLGYVSDAQLSNVYVVDQRHWTTSLFLQDDWKATSKLTLNLGLRYDFITPALEAQDRQTNFIPEGGGSLVYAKDGSLEERGLVSPDYNNFAPRLGAVYKLDEKTQLRGGYGIFYNMFDRIGSEDQLALNPPGLINNVTPTATTTPIFLLSQGFPSNFLDVNQIDYRRVRIRAVKHDVPKTMVHQFSVGVQRLVTESLVFSLDAVGTLGRNMANLRNLNQPTAIARADGRDNALGPLPYPNFGFIEWRENSSPSSYKGIDVSLEKRFRRGYGFGLAYTLSRSRDRSGEHLQTPTSFPQSARDLSAWEGPSDYDIPHRFVGNFVVELPFGEGKRFANEGVGRAVLGGWLVSGVYVYRSGRPFTVTQSGNNVGTNMTGLPDHSGSGNDPHSVDRWFDPTAFTAVPSGVFGNSGRNILRGQQWQTLDLSVQRRFRTGGTKAATLRWDVFNVFDRANLGLPDSNISNTATVGTISSLGGDPRIMQFSLRLQF